MAQQNVPPSVSSSLRTLLNQVEEEAALDVIILFQNAPTDEAASTPLLAEARSAKHEELIAQSRQVQEPVMDVVADQGPGCLAKTPVAYDEAAVQRFELLNAAALPANKELIVTLAKLPQVQAIIPNQTIHLIAPEEATQEGISVEEAAMGATWGLTRLGIPQLHSQGFTGDGIRIGHLDSGVYADHPDLVGKIGAFVAFDWLGRRLDVQPPFDAGEHGTHIAGTLVGGQTAEGISIGVAPQATLYSAAVLLGTPSIEGFLSGVDWVTIEHNVDLINMSLSIQYYDPDLEHRFKRLWISGHIPVAAIGNRRYGASDSPGNLTAVVGVGATDNRDGVASFSGGATLSKYDPAGSKYVHEVKPDVAAPGVEVYSCVPHQPQGLKYKKMSGTSMAAPHVTGVLALLLQATRNRKRKKKTPAQIVRILYRTAQQLGDPGHNNRYGRGLIDPAAALAKV